MRSRTTCTARARCTRHVDADETQELQVPPPEEHPVVWDRARPRYFGLTPHGLVAAIAAISLGAAVVLLVGGSLLPGVLLLVAAALLFLLYLEQARRRRDSALDRIAAAAVDHTRALAGFTGSSVRNWTTGGREIARLRMEASRLQRERSQHQYALGAACYSGDDAETERLREAMRQADESIAACVAQAHDVVERMRDRTAHEKLAVSKTEIRPR